MEATQAEVQIWLETRHEAAQVIVVPWVRSMRDVQLGFRLNAICRSEGGVSISRSTVSQQGQLSLAAGHSERLGQLSLRSTPQMKCEIEIAVQSGGRDAQVHRFDLGDA